MRRFSKIVLLAAALAAVARRADAQGLGIELNGGMQGMQYKLSGGNNTPLPGGSLGLTYTFALGHWFGVRTGILGSVYRTQATLKDGTFTYGQVDDGGSAFDYNVKVTGYKETQQFFAATIPLLLHFHTGGPGMQWSLDAGGKLIFPFNSTIQASAQQLSLSGYYPNFHIVVSNLPQHGFGTQNGWHASSSTVLKPAGALSAGTGVSFALSSRSHLYVGIFADYGLTDLRDKPESLPLVSYSSAGVGKVKANGVLNTSNSGAAGLLSLGVQVRLSFGSPRPAGRHKKAVRRDSVEVVTSVTQTHPPKKNPVAVAATTGATVAATEPKAAASDTRTPTPDSTVGARDSLSLDALIRADQLRNEKRNEAERSRRNIVFGIIGETNIPETQLAKLDELVGLLKAHPDLRLSVEGHFCDSLMEKENSQTAAARVKAVVRYLENKGIDHRRMDIGYARKSDPVLSYDPASNYRNRRVAIRIIGSF